MAMSRASASYVRKEEKGNNTNDLNAECKLNSILCTLLHVVYIIGVALYHYGIFELSNCHWL